MVAIDGQGNVLIKGEDFHWLLERAERVQELESKLNKQIEIGYKFEGEVYDLAKENKRYREALKYYADEKHYEPYCIDGYGCDVTEDCGEIARKALEGEE